jgi:RNA recognition motif-containing protein
LIEDRETGRSRGFGFVEMSTKEEGAAAISQFNGKELGGRALTVNEAKPREDRNGGGGRGGSRY